MNISQKIKNLSWFNLVEKLRDILENILEKQVEPKVITTQSYTLKEEDYNKDLYFTNPLEITVTVPNNLPKNRSYRGKQMGDGQVVFIGSSGVTIFKSSTDTNKTEDKYSVFGLDSVGNEEYVLYGKLELTT